MVCETVKAGLSEASNVSGCTLRLVTACLVALAIQCSQLTPKASQFHYNSVSSVTKERSVEQLSTKIYDSIDYGSPTHLIKSLKYSRTQYNGQGLQQSASSPVIKPTPLSRSHCHAIQSPMSGKQLRYHKKKAATYCERFSVGAASRTPSDLITLPPHLRAHYDQFSIEIQLNSGRIP